MIKKWQQIIPGGPQRGYIAPVMIEGLAAHPGGKVFYKKATTIHQDRGNCGTARCFIKGFYYIIETIH